MIIHEQQTKDGKALGRWVNNQRSSKNKGSLKKEREDRLLSTGLKWSVLSTNAWPDMMNELRIYVAEKVRQEIFCKRVWLYEYCRMLYTFSNFFFIG